MTEPTQTIVVRLRQDQYLQLERKFSKAVVTDQTSPAQAGYQLGIEAVLKELRNGFVLED